MGHKSKNKNQGSALIALLLGLAIIAILAAIYYGGFGSNQKSVRQTRQKAIEQAKANNALEIQQNIETQNELNSIGN